MDLHRVQTQKGDRVARVTVTNFYGNIVLDTLMNPFGKVLDFRFETTNIKKSDLCHAPTFPRVAEIVSKSNFLDLKLAWKNPS